MGTVAGGYYDGTLLVVACASKPAGVVRDLEVIRGKNYLARLLKVCL